MLCCALSCTSCARATSPAPTATQAATATIVAATLAPQDAPIPTSTPQLQVVPSQPTSAAATAPTATPVAFTYLWPAYLPDGMYVSPSESRVPHPNEVGSTSAGFYIVTFNSDTRKLIVGGGATDTLVLKGDTRAVNYDASSATLTTDGEQRQLVFIKNSTKYFIYGRNISEQEIMLVAESMVPNDIAAIQDIVAGQQP